VICDNNNCTLSAVERAEGEIFTVYTNILMKRRRTLEMEHPILAPFGEESIVELSTKGNSNFARGAFGEISIALRRENATFELVAIKTIEHAVSGETNSFGSSSCGIPILSREVANELCALRQLNPHPNIAPLVACFLSKSSFSAGHALSLAFEYSPTDLYLTLEWRRRKLLPPVSYPTIKAISCDLFAALAHCHRLGVLHRDIKPGNLLITSAGRVQLCDFGLAKLFLGEDGSSLPAPTSGETGTKGLCTLWYRPPEVLLGGSAAHPAVDIYSAGLVLAELLAGRPLFKGPTNVVGQLSRIYEVLGSPSETRWPTAKLLPDHGKLMFAAHEPKQWSDVLPRVTECQGLDNLIAGTVALDPSQRLSAAKVLDHTFLVTKHGKSHTATLTQELVPPSLAIPPLLAGDNASVMTAVAFSLAKKRKSLLAKDVMEWQGSDLPSVTLQSKMAQC
jgi:serine/threonine protein kinase